jgi:hypothetical protein
MWRIDPFFHLLLSGLRQYTLNTTSSHHHINPSFLSSLPHHMSRPPTVNRTDEYDPNNPLMRIYQQTPYTAPTTRSLPFPPPTANPPVPPLPSSIIPPRITGAPNPGAVTDPELEEMHQRFNHALRHDNTDVMQAEFQNVLSVARARGNDKGIETELFGTTLSAFKDEDVMLEQRSEAQVADVRLQLSALQSRVVDLEQELAATGAKGSEEASSGETSDQ